MENPTLLTYPGFDVSFSVPRDHNPDEIDVAVSKIKRDVKASSERHLPRGCVVEIQDTV